MPRLAERHQGFLRLPEVGPARRQTPTSLSRALPPVVYAIRTEDGLIKIGHTVNLASRKRFYGSGWDRILTIVPGSRDDEAALHKRFGAHLARGREYFRPASEILDWIDETRATLGVRPADRG